MKALIITNARKQPSATELANIAARLGVTECELVKVDMSDDALRIMAACKAEWLDFNVDWFEEQAQLRQERRAA